MFTELEKHEKEIREKSKLSEEEFNNFLDLLESRIVVNPKEEYKNQLKKANKISPDPDDTEYIALALRFDAKIWSYDKQSKEEQKIRIFS